MTLRYSQCWEDVACARTALRIQPGDTVFAIGAAGDNVLAMLLDGPAQVIAVDLEPSQCALVNLKVAAASQLEPSDVAPFLTRGDRAPERYELLRRALDRPAQAYWDQNTAAIDSGVIHSGRFERYLALFRRWLLRFVPGRKVVSAMLSARTLAEQQQIFATQWDSWRWRALFRAFFGRRWMGLLGRDPSYFQYCAVKDVAAHYLERARLVLTALPLTNNPYLAYILSGHYDRPSRWPTYLLPDTLADIRPRLSRIDVRNVSIAEGLADCTDRSVDAFYLSDVFELMDQPAYERTLLEIARVGKPGARLCYWNNLVARSRPAHMAGTIAIHDEIGQRLHRRDRSFLYSRFVVESVRGVES